MAFSHVLLRIALREHLPEEILSHNPRTRFLLCSRISDKLINCLFIRKRTIYCEHLHAGEHLNILWIVPRLQCLGRRAKMRQSTTLRFNEIFLKLVRYIVLGPRSACFRVVVAVENNRVVLLERLTDDVLMQKSQNRLSIIVMLKYSDNEITIGITAVLGKGCFNLFGHVLNRVGNDCVEHENRYSHAVS